MLTYLRVTGREDAVWLVPPSLHREGSTWGQAEPCCLNMASRYEYLLKHSVKQVMPVSLSC